MGLAELAVKFASLQDIMPNLALIAFDNYRWGYFEQELNKIDAYTSTQKLPHVQSFYDGAKLGKRRDTLYMPTSIHRAKEYLIERKAILAENPAVRYQLGAARTYSDASLNQESQTHPTCLLYTSPSPRD